MRKSCQESPGPSNSKVCAVCGDKAFGLNFAAISCESCKAFFRRNALSNKKFVCPFNSEQSCEITIVTRRFCQYHRLQKCFNVGMKKEYIMSEEDKEIKRKKIEQNRVKRKFNNTNENSLDSDKTDDCRKILKTENYNSNENSNSESPNLRPTEYKDSAIQDNGTLDINSSTSEIVEKIVSLGADDRSGQFISSLMKNQKDALFVMTKIIKCPDNALRLIDHFIKYPSDAVLILSKIMNSPFDSLMVFTQFMRSPTDALQIVSKIMSNPNEVLIFLQQLMKFPEDALKIMNKFLNSPIEAIQILNKMMNHSSLVNLLPLSSESTKSDSLDDHDVIKSMLSIKSNSTNLSVDEESQSSSTFHIKNMIGSPSMSIYDTNNNDSKDEKKSLLDIANEVISDVKEASTSQSQSENALDSIISEAISIEFGGPRPMISNVRSRTRELNEIEQAKLNELNLSNKALYEPIDDDLSNFIFEDYKMKTSSDPNLPDPQLLKVINLTAIAIRRLIKMSKKISAFKNLCIEDQIALLKGGCTEMMILRSIIQYDCARASWKIPHSQEDSHMANIRADVLKLAKGNVYEEHDRFIQNFPEMIRNDENVILIMCAITLFSPNRSKTIHKDVIKLEQNSYYYLLRVYLESVFDGCQARSLFLQLINKINELHKLNDEFINVYLNVNPSQIEPLLREIFDLKSQ